MKSTTKLRKRNEDEKKTQTILFRYEIMFVYVCVSYFFEGIYTATQYALM